MARAAVAVLGIFVADLAFKAPRLPVMGETILGLVLHGRECQPLRARSITGHEVRMREQEPRPGDRP